MKTVLLTVRNIIVSLSVVLGVGFLADKCSASEEATKWSVFVFIGLIFIAYCLSLARQEVDDKKKRNKP